MVGRDDLPNSLARASKLVSTCSVGGEIAGAIAAAVADGVATCSKLVVIGWAG